MLRLGRLLPIRPQLRPALQTAFGSTPMHKAQCPPHAACRKIGANWIKTLPNKGWFTYFRLYGPTRPCINMTWVLPEIKPMD